VFLASKVKEKADLNKVGNQTVLLISDFAFLGYVEMKTRWHWRTVVK